MSHIIFIVIISGAFLCYSYAFDKKGFSLEPQARAAAWFGFVVFGLVLLGRLVGN